MSSMFSPCTYKIDVVVARELARHFLRVARERLKHLKVRNARPFSAVVHVLRSDIDVPRQEVNELDVLVTEYMRRRCRAYP